MKFLALIIFLSLTNIAFGQFWRPKPTPTPVPVAQVVVKPENTTSIQEARKIIKELTSELQIAKEENQKLKTNLENANGKINDAESNTATVQKQADVLRAWGIERQNEAFEWMAKHKKISDKYKKLKTIASLVGGIFGLIFGIWAMRFVPPIYAAYAFALPIVTTLLTSGWVWIFF
jgi:hypothetical protein